MKKQFSKLKPKTEDLDCDNVKRTILDFVPLNMNTAGKTSLYHILTIITWLTHVPAGHKTSFCCSAYVTSLPCLRVSTVPVYWEANKRARGSFLHPQVRRISDPKLFLIFIPIQAKIGERAQLTECKVGMNCSVSDKTSLTGVCLGMGSRVEEKVRLSNCVVMENVVIESGSNIEDSIICDNCTISSKSSVKLSILGRGQKTVEGAEVVSQLVLDKDTMMEV